MLGDKYLHRESTASLSPSLDARGWMHMLRLEDRHRASTPAASFPHTDSRNSITLLISAMHCRSHQQGKVINATTNLGHVLTLTISGTVRVQ